MLDAGVGAAGKDQSTVRIVVGEQERAEPRARAFGIGPANHSKRAHEFGRYLLLHIGPLIDEMHLARNEVELALAYLLAESLSHRSKGIRKALTANGRN
jgi:hypothetical protein